MEKIKEKVEKSFQSLKNICEKEQFKGWDPYDGLNSLVFKHSPFKFSRNCRLAWIQAFKKSPINLRPILLVKKDYNPKGIALFLSAYCNLFKMSPVKNHLETINFLADTLIELSTPGYSGDCWGYNFNWQSRLEYMPKKTPTIVVTSFAAYALLDAFDCTGEDKYLHSAISSCNFVIHDLYRTPKKKGFIFSYSPLDKMVVYNASLLGSRLLSRVFFYNKDSNLINTAKASVSACSAAQRKDGAWIFGENKIQNWVDSFHTGYKLESISEYQKYSGDNSYKSILKKGIQYYLDNFFLPEGIPKYYDNKKYPIDIHCPAQFIVTLSRLDLLTENINIVKKVLNWTIDNMQHKSKGYFYYQLKKGKSSKINYIRWGQAWMMYAMSYYLLEMNKKQKNG